jgi:CheY-like chemotaxis protein
MGARILVADDSVTIQKVVELTLSREGVELVPARSGEEAIRKAQEIKPDLMLIDLSMPDTSGYEVCATLRKNPLFKEVPIILLAGTFEPFNEAEGRRVGASDFVGKPFDSQTLIGKVRQLLSSKPVAPAVPAAPEPAVVPPPSEEFILELEEVPSHMAFTVEPPTPSVIEPPAQVVPEEPAIPVYDLTLEEVPGFPLKAVVPEEAVVLQEEERLAPILADSPAELTFGLVELEVAPEIQQVQEVQAVQVPSQALPIPPETMDTLAQEVADKVAAQIVQELKRELLDRVERVVWEVVPDLAEHLITQEIQRIRNEVEGKR